MTIMMTDSKGCKTGFVCECGTKVEYPAYVAAHWYEELTHTCAHCQRKHTVLQGIAKLVPEASDDD